MRLSTYIGVIVVSAGLFAPVSIAEPTYLGVNHKREIQQQVTLADAQKSFVTYSTADGKHYLTGKALTEGPLTIPGVGDVQVVSMTVEPSRVVGSNREYDLKVRFEDSKGNALSLPYLADAVANSGVVIDNVKKTVKATLSSGEKKSVMLTITSGGATVGTSSLEVVEPVKRLGTDGPNNDQNRFRLIEGGRARDPGIVLEGANTGKIYRFPERDLVLAPNDTVDMQTDGTLKAKELPDVLPGDEIKPRLEFTTRDGAAAPLPFFVEVQLKAGYITVEGPSVLPVNGEIALRAIWHARSGAPSLPVPIFRWDVPNEHKAYVRVAQSNDRARVIWVGPTDDPRMPVPHVVDVTVTSTGDAGGAPFTLPVPLRISGFPVAFEPLDVQLTVVDDSTVADLYGKKTSQEFYVARVRFNNNLKDKQGNFTGASILAFSDSIEVGVTLEKRRTPERQREYIRQEAAKQRTTPPDWKENYWLRVEESELSHFVRDRKPKPATPPFSLRSGTVKVLPLYTTAVPVPDEVELVPDSKCTGVLTYRPHTFEMVVNSHDPRSDRSRRAITFQILNTVGTLASFGTSISPPTGGSVPAAMDKYANLLIPGLAKLFPSLKETQRQNIVSQTMKPIEEIPFGSDLSRVLFFPKRGFGGVLTGYETRIGEICPFEFTIQVAVLNKGDRRVVGPGSGQ